MFEKVELKLFKRFFLHLSPQLGPGLSNLINSKPSDRHFAFRAGKDNLCMTTCLVCPWLQPTSNTLPPPSVHPVHPASCQHIASDPYSPLRSTVGALNNYVKQSHWHCKSAETSETKYISSITLYPGVTKQRVCPDALCILHQTGQIIKFYLPFSCLQQKWWPIYKWRNVL